MPAGQQGFGPYKLPPELAEQYETQPLFSGRGADAYPSEELWAPQEPTEVWNGTAIPTSYKVNNPISSQTQGRAEVTPDATKTLIQGAQRPLENGGGSALTPFERQMIEVDRFSHAVSEVLRRDPKPDQFYRAGGYDIKFSPPTVPGDMPRITEIVPYGAIQDYRDDTPKRLSNEEVRTLGYDKLDHVALDAPTSPTADTPDANSSTASLPIPGLPSFSLDEADAGDILEYIRRGNSPIQALEFAKHDKRRAQEPPFNDPVWRGNGGTPGDSFKAPNPPLAFGNKADTNDGGPRQSGDSVGNYRQEEDGNLQGPWGELSQYAPHSDLYIDKHYGCYSFDPETGIVTRINTDLAARIAKTGRSSGEWIEGERGNGRFRSNDAKATELTGKAGVVYKNGYPILDRFSVASIEIGPISLDRSQNFRQAAMKLMADPFLLRTLGIDEDGGNGLTWSAIERWRVANGYTWHETEDMKTLQLVPRILNAKFPHIGGIGESQACLRLRKAVDDYNQ